MSKQASLRIQGYLKIVNELETISDCNYNIARTIIRKQKKNVVFTEELKNNVLQMFELCEGSLNNMITNLNSSGKISIDKAYEWEDKINKKRDTLKKEHLKNVEKNHYNYLTGVIYNDIVCECEKFGDYVLNVSESLYEIESKHG